MSTATLPDSSRARRARGGSASRPPVGAAPLERSRRRMFWAFTAPAVLVYVVLFLVPVGYGRGPASTSGTASARRSGRA